MNTRGFTLVETILYVAIVGSVLTAFVLFGLSITRNRVKNLVVTEVQYTGKHAIDIAGQLIREADDVVTPAEGNSATSLVLDMPGTPDNTTIALNAGRVEITEGSGPPTVTPITPDIITVSSLNFINRAAAGEKDNIVISFTAEFENNPTIEYQYSQDFEAGITIRRD